METGGRLVDPSDVQAIATSVQAIATTLGILGAGVFFLFKAAYGYNNVNCSIGVTCERQHKDNGTDFVSATVTIDKGPNTALSLLRGEVQFSPADTAQPVELRLHRLAVSEGGSGLSVCWDVLAPERALYVSPGEKLHFACVAEVPRSEPCRVEAIVLGRKRLRRLTAWARSPFLAQWRATAVSLPLVDASADIAPQPTASVSGAVSGRG
jgi:hypothetical protein